MNRLHTLSLVVSLCLAWPITAAEKPIVVELWPGKPPDETGKIGAEYVRMSPKLDRKQVEVTEPTRMITNVTKPTVTIYRPAKDKDTGTAMLICPGGGYWNLYWELEGEEVAAWLNSLGVTGIILKYRVPRRPGEPEREPARRPLQDAQRAVSLVRSKAKDKDEIAPGLHVPAGTPPVFLAHGGADIVSEPEHSVLMYLALRRAGIPAELHIYAGAAHDFGVRASDHPCSTWTQACAQWLGQQGLLKPPK